MRAKKYGRFFPCSFTLSELVPSAALRKKRAVRSLGNYTSFYQKTNSNHTMSMKAVAILQGDKTSGTVWFTQASADAPVKIVADINGLSDGLHGFHCHQCVWSRGALPLSLPLSLSLSVSVPLRPGVVSAHPSLCACAPNYLRPVCRFGDRTNGCMSAGASLSGERHSFTAHRRLGEEKTALTKNSGGHFNPAGTNHGGLTGERHAGDWGKYVYWGLVT